MKGLERFIESRKAGKLIGREILLNIGRDGAKWWVWPQLFTWAEGRVDSPKDDFRVLIGLDVVLVCDKYDSNAAAIFQKVKSYARSIVFVILGKTNDGIVWINGEEREL